MWRHDSADDEVVDLSDAELSQVRNWLLTLVIHPIIKQTTLAKRESEQPHRLARTS